MELISERPRLVRRLDAVALTFVATALLAAMLLFILEPLFAKMALPALGGSSEVWTACVLFYQFILLAGYVYANWLRRLPRMSSQFVIHGVLCVLAAFALPVTIRGGLPAPDAAHALPWLLCTLTLSVGLPFFVLSATSPLLQSWFAGMRPGADPYQLYAASNAGSLFALVCYPFAIEPFWGLRLQSHFWSIGFFWLAALLVVCAAAARSSAGSVRVDAISPRISWRRRFRWMMLAFVPSSLMLSVTLCLSERVAPIPLLWTVPLAIYLASFVVVFARGWHAPTLPDRAVAIMLPLLVVILGLNVNQVVLFAIVLHATAFGLIAIVCHGALAADKPEPDRLTEFYCYLAFGGLLGGVFNSVLAPIVFSDIYEYPIVIVLAALALRPRAHTVTRHARELDIALPLGLGLILWAATMLEPSSPIFQNPRMMPLVFLAGAIVCFSFSSRPLRFALGLAAIFVIGASHVAHATLATERNFYGVKRINASSDGIHELAHGRTIHGSEHIGGDRERVPTTYYTQSGPLGDIVAALRDDRHPMAIVGLGVGSVACYRRPHQPWTFYELDPGVVAIARDTRYFRYVHDCAPNDPIVVGDGRLEMAKAGLHSYGLIVMDAYSSDAIPTHLLTREALRLYESRLAFGGLIAFHISNSYFSFGPVIAALAKDANLVVRMRTDDGAGSFQAEDAKLPSQWVVVARTLKDMHAIAGDKRWEAVRPAARLWTDDYTSLVTVLRAARL